MHHFALAQTFLGFDFSGFWHAFLMFVATYLGANHGTKNGTKNGNGASH